MTLRTNRRTGDTCRLSSVNGALKWVKMDSGSTVQAAPLPTANADPFEEMRQSSLCSEQRLVRQL